jgi:protein-S-isoprenylcysteine O-methyltransferase Ste14
MLPMVFLLRGLTFLSVLVGILFGAAGRWDLPFFWAYVGICTAALLAIAWAIKPDLMRERMRPAPGGEDRKLRLLLTPFALACVLFAALDVGRLHWSDTVPLGVQVAGLAGVALGLTLVVWSMVANRFFSPTVRIQHERGHHLVTSGPYHYVRHPGYIGMVLTSLGTPLALGSWWALLPATGYALLIVRRTVREDHFLREHLDGYAGYASQVRYRLVPRLW